MRYELADYEWAAIKPMLPNKPRGVPRVNDRRVLNGIFWVLRSGAPWRDLPEAFGPYASSRQCSQRRRMGRGAQARRGAISGQRLTHLFRADANPEVYEYLEAEGIKVCDPVTGEPCPAREDCISADAAGRTTSERDAAIPREFHYQA